MIRELTVRHRRKLAFALVGIVAPKLKKDLSKALELHYGLPRPFTKMLKHQYQDKPLVGCEIGFGFGENAENLLQELNIAKLYCVDPYFGSTNYNDTGINVDWYQKPSLADAKRMRRIYNHHKTKFIIETSDTAFNQKLIPNELDFIYIDGNHSKDYCYRDIVNSLKFVRNGGYVGGHDFANGSWHGVAEAVYQYQKDTGLAPHMEFPDFWFQKTDG